VSEVHYLKFLIPTEISLAYTLMYYKGVESLTWIRSNLDLGTLSPSSPRYHRGSATPYESAAGYDYMYTTSSE